MEKEAEKGRNLIISVLYSRLLLIYLIHNSGQLLFLTVVLCIVTILLTLSDKALRNFISQ